MAGFWWTGVGGCNYYSGVYEDTSILGFSADTSSGSFGFSRLV